jgi:hypothetical protein
VQDLSTVKESWPSIPEDRAAREARRLLVAQKKEDKDAAKKRQLQKALECEALGRQEAQRWGRRRCRRVARACRGLGPWFPYPGKYLALSFCHR